MKTFDRIVRGLARLGIALAALSLLATLALIAYSVFMRYVVNRPTAWVDELAGYLLVACIMLAVADALFHGEHIAVDLVTERLGATGRRLTLLGGLVAVAISGVLLAIEGAGMVSFSRMVGLVSNGYLAVPMWVPQLLVPIGGLLLTLAATAAFAGALRKRDDADGPEQPHRLSGIE